MAGVASLQKYQRMCVYVHTQVVQVEAGHVDLTVVEHVPVVLSADGEVRHAAGTIGSEILWNTCAFI